METWLSSSLVRNYPGSKPRRRKILTLDAARGESVSFQVGFRSDDTELRVTAVHNAPDPLSVEVRQVGYVPLLHHTTLTPPEELDGIGHIPGLVPDPLLPEASIYAYPKPSIPAKPWWITVRDTIHAGPLETNAFWVTVRVPTDAKPGRYPVSITLTAENIGGDGKPQGKSDPPAELTATVRVHRAVLPPRRDFHVLHWFYADALCDWYHTELWEESFWPLLDSYLANVVSHGDDTILVPLFTPPTDGVKRPTQLLHVSRQGDDYSFDWALVRRWVRAAKAQGFSLFDWPHFFTQWGVDSAVRIYEGHGEDGKLLWAPETDATSPTYRGYLAQFLPEFERFLRTEGILDASFFHVSDEPSGNDLPKYHAAYALLRELAPWIKPESIRDPVRKEGPSHFIFSCGRRGRQLSRFLDTPLPKLRMAGPIYYKIGVQGVVDWTYNYWYKSQTTQLIDPYQITDAHLFPMWPAGDAFVVYPGEAGPVDSMRWEIFAESLQDYALLQAADISQDDPMLAEIKDSTDFPRDERWIRRFRRQLLTRLDQQN